MADMQNPQHPMEVLPAMLNLVLLQTSKILREPECHNIKHVGPPSRRITEIVSTANQRFHDALDEIEVEILQAKAVMERDLRVIRHNRAERDRDNGPLQALSPPKEARHATGDAGVTSGEGVSAESTSELPVLLEAENALMTDHAADIRPQAPTAQMQALPSKDDDRAITDAMDSIPQDSEDLSGLATTMPSDSTAKVQDFPESAENRPTDPTTTAPEASLDTTDPAVFDFESMFNDNDLINTDDTASFGLDFSTDSIGQTVMQDSTFENMNMSDADMSNMAPTSNEDINSLLPGLENYVNADTDLTTLGMPPTSTLPQASQSAPNTEGMAPADSNIDDLFSGMDFDLPSNGGDEMEESNILDLDDFNWDL